MRSRTATLCLCLGSCSRLQPLANSFVLHPRHGCGSTARSQCKAIPAVDRGCTPGFSVCRKRPRSCSQLGSTGESASWQSAAAQAQQQQQQQQPVEEISDENDDFPSYLDDLDDDIWDEYNEGGDDGAEEEDYMDIPSGSLLGNMAFNPERDEGGLGDVTLADIADDYNFPVEFIYDVLCRWGVSPPIKLDDKLGSLVNGEQAFAVVEALTSVDPATVHDFYLDDTIEELAWALDVPLADIFAVCGRRRFNLPLGAETHLTNEEYRFLLKDLGFEEELKAMEDRLHRRDREDVDADAARRPDPSGMFMSDMFNGDIDEMFADDEEYSGTAPQPRAKPFFL